ncbi:MULTISPECIES: type IV pilus major pilin [unclassified Enterobacter cloacae complex]|uniref:type IV pilus major pilin n=1 Tax=unclassified Enterobacter cloacae complex TaxID=2757714 RepID=UPI001866B4AF|nr:MULTISPECIES: type IV pilus major pilin [unclassified Enterobacter cloacae complex]MBE3514043.1 type IV pilus major pilin [Enterobacter cloacae complex sp. I2]MBE4966487.1 type IV pilus major pilin [Enterobacter cloacae complex sp. P24RS]
MNALVWKLKGNMNRKAAKLQEMRKQRGVTLLEIIIVLGIIGVIAAGVVILAQRAFTAQDLSDIQNNANSIRTSMAEAFKDEGSYPASDTIVGLTKSSISASASKAPIVTLVKLGKVSPEESFNGISNDAFQLGNAKLDDTSSQSKAFVLVVNGLETEECRNLISQMGNQWDYVEAIKDGANAGKDVANIDGKNLSVAKSGAILKTMISGEIKADEITATNVCDGAGAINGVIFGSK